MTISQTRIESGKIPEKPKPGEQLQIAVSKGFVENVRGIDSSSVVNNLVEKGLVEEAGRLDVPGKPIVYRTTSVFLRSFGLSSLSELPPLTGDSGQCVLEGFEDEII